ncbi:MAG: glycosyltransferase family 4 protein [Verrucomicrobiales bacterium]|nr:glycosyltransferase family 4 protein [Verrucomicrobiales bacterium]
MKISHILYSGVGGQAGVVFTMVRASGASVTHGLAFYGSEEVAAANARTCGELGVVYGAFRKGYGVDLGGQWRMAKWIASERPDVIVTHNPAAVLGAKIAAKKCGAKVVLVEHHSNVLKGRKEWAMSLAGHLLADCAVYLTESYRECVRAKLGKFFDEAKSRVIPNGLELGAYGERVGSRRAGGVVVGMQGRMVRGKDFGTLLRAVARMRHGKFFQSLRVELAGDGPEMSRLQRMVKELRIDGTVHFLGMLPQAELAERMRGWDVFVLSTLGETMSVALMEAQACGLPVVATDVSGVSDVVADGENGFLVEPGDDAAMALRMVELISDEGLRRLFGRRSIGYAEAELPASLMWERYRAVFVETSNENGRPGASDVAAASV